MEELEQLKLPVKIDYKIHVTQQLKTFFHRCFETKIVHSIAVIP